MMIWKGKSQVGCVSPSGVTHRNTDTEHLCGVRRPGVTHRISVKYFGALRLAPNAPYEATKLVGPVRRGSGTWQNLYNKRTSAERTNSYDQEVIAKGRKQRFRGLKAFSFSGSVRTLAQLLRRTVSFVLNVTYTLGGLAPLNA